MAGVIYLVATPIGNLEDITLRALKTLSQVDCIACEDTRHTRRLLAHYEIEKPLVSYHDHNEQARATELVERALGGESIAVVSDAGSPGIADPGFRVAQAAAEAGVPVVPLPGACAFVSALTASGLASDRFVFGGFLPSKKGKRRSALEEVATDARTHVLYETPHRILDALDELAELMPERPLVLARELTKVHEEFLRGTAVEIRTVLAERPTVKGEMVLVIGPGEARAVGPDEPLDKRVEDLIAGGTGRMEAIKQAARERGLSKREVYSQLEGKSPAKK